MRKRVLVLGGGGREHALAWKLAQSPDVAEVLVGPGNAGTGMEEKCRNVPDLAKEKGESWQEYYKRFYPVVCDMDIDLVVPGSENLLVGDSAGGIVDYFERSGLVKAGHFIFGPTRAAAMIEGSKSFAKEVMGQARVPTAPACSLADYEAAKEELEHMAGKNEFPLVVKANGLAAGKGAYVCETLDDAMKALNEIMVEQRYGDSGDEVLIEDFLEGEEASIHALTDGNASLTLASAQDHKRAYDNDQGPNTGGMGAYSPAPVMMHGVEGLVDNEIIDPTIREFSSREILYSGCLYGGLMIKDGKPSVVEFNARFGDPETQPVLMRMKNDLFPIMMECADPGGDLELGDYFIENRPGAAITVVMASKGYPGPYEKKQKIAGLEAAEGVPGVKVFHAGTEMVDGKILAVGGRVLGVSAYADSGLGDAQICAYDAVRIIEQATAKLDNPWQSEYRNDIGDRGLNR